MSTTEERAQMLYDKALAELNTYLENMKTKPPQEIINSAYQIVNKQDLLMILESAEFTPAELNVLNELEHPLQVLYEEWLPVEDRHMEELRDSVQSYLDTRLQHRAEKLYADPVCGSVTKARTRKHAKRARYISTVPTENATVRVSTLSQRISAMPTKRVGCASSCRSGHRNLDMTAVNFFLDTRCSAPTGTDGTLLHPSVKPPKRTITLRRNMTRFRSSTRTRIPAW